MAMGPVQARLNPQIGGWSFERLELYKPTSAPLFSALPLIRSLPLSAFHGVNAFRPCVLVPSVLVPSASRGVASLEGRTSAWPTSGEPGATTVKVDRTHIEIACSSEGQSVDQAPRSGDTSPRGSAQRPPVRLGLSRSAFTSFSPATPSVTSPGPSYHKKPAPPATVAPTRPIPFAPAAAAPSDRTKSASTAGASYDWLSGAASDGRHQASRTELSKLGPSASTASFAVAPAPHAGLHQLPFVPGLAANMHPHVNPEMLDRMMLALSQQHQQQTSEQLSRAAAASQHRAEAVARFLKKRKERCFDKKVRYASRQRLAETRPRIRGQFVKAADLAAYRAGTLPGAPRPQAQASSEGSGGSGQAEGSC